MLWSGRITLMIMIYAIVLTHSSTDRELVQIPRSKFSPFGSKHPIRVYQRGNSIRHFNSRNCKRRKYRLKPDKNWNLEPVNIKLKNIFDKYDFKWKEVKAFYTPVIPCIPDKCGKTQDVLLGNLPPKGFECTKFKTCKRLKKKILNILTKLHVGLQNLAERFQNLIMSLQKEQHRSSRGRLRILNEFKNELKMLNIETEAVMTIKRLNNSRHRKSLTAAVPTLSETSKINRTHLLIHEWLTLENSKKFVDVWKENFSHVFTCWRKMNENFHR